MEASAAKIPKDANEKQGVRLRAIREGLKFSGKEASDASGIKPARLAALEKGADPKLTELVGLARKYEYTPGGLVTRLVKGG